MSKKIASAPVIAYSSLGTYPHNALTLIDGIAVNNQIDVGIAERFAQFVGATMTSAQSRASIIESLERLRNRLHKAEHRKCVEVTNVVPAMVAIDKAIVALEHQPDVYSSAGNGYQYRDAESPTSEQIIAGASRRKATGAIQARN